MPRRCSECKFATYDDSTGKLLIFCTRPRPRENQIDGWTRDPSNLFSPFKKLTSEACLLFVKKEKPTG